MQDVGEQAPPAVHAEHVPLLHTWLVPHVWPFATLATFEVHCDDPVAHDVCPVWHWLPLGLHAAPAVHATH